MTLISAVKNFLDLIITEIKYDNDARPTFSNLILKDFCLKIEAEIISFNQKCLFEDMPADCSSIAAGS